MLQVKDKIIFGLTAIIIVLVLILLNKCKEQQSCKVEWKERIIYRDQPPAPPLDIPKAKQVRVNVNIPVYVVDSSALQRVIAERDSLTKKLQDSSVKITFAMDTVHTVTHDTLKVICDEIKRNIEVSLHYAPRPEKVIIQTETIIKEVSWFEKLLYACGGYALAEVLHQLFK